MGLLGMAKGEGGRGLLGKRLSALFSWQELDDDVVVVGKEYLHAAINFCYNIGKSKSEVERES